MDERDTILGRAARTYNILTAKLQYSFVPMSINMFKDMPEFRDTKPIQIRDCLHGLHKKGLVRVVPFHNPANRHERVGYEWIHAGLREAPDYKTRTEVPSILPMPMDVPKIPAIENWIRPKSCQTTPVLQDLHLKVNDDGSVTILTSKIRITIEL